MWDKFGDKSSVEVAFLFVLFFFFSFLGGGGTVCVLSKSLEGPLRAGEKGSRLLGDAEGELSTVNPQKA